MFRFVGALGAVHHFIFDLLGDRSGRAPDRITRRPVRRSQVLLGKSLGLAAPPAGYAGIVRAGKFAIVDGRSVYSPANLVLHRVPVHGEALLTISHPSRTTLLVRRWRPGPATRLPHN
jgi:hypothetical protein